MRRIIKSKWEKLPKVKVEYDTGVETVRSENYFWDKQCDPDEVAKINPLLLVSGKEKETQDKLQKMKSLLLANPDPMTIHGKTMKPRDKNAEVPFHQALAGGLVRESTTGKPILTHEYGHKSFQNLCYALGQR